MVSRILTQFHCASHYCTPLRLMVGRVGVEPTFSDFQSGAPTVYATDPFKKIYKTRIRILQFTALFLIILLFMSYYGQTLRELNSYYFGHDEACYHYTKRSILILGAEALELHQLYPPYEGGPDTYLPPAIWHPRQDSNLQNTRGQSPQPLTIRPRGYIFGVN